MKPKVAVVRCPTYDDCREGIGRALELSGLGAKLRGRRVLLKVNLMKGAEPEKCINTHPRFVAALTALLVENGCEVHAGDSTGVLGFTDEALRAAGLDEAIVGAGGRVANLDAGPFQEVEVPGELFRAFWLPRILADVDAVVSVPKLKTHTLTGMTAAVKNLVGVLPGGGKCEVHVRGPDPRGLSRAIVDLYLAVRPAGAVVDGVWALAGQGKGVGPVPVRPGVVIAGESCPAVDVICAEALGLAPEEVPTIRAAAERGVGPGSRAEVETVGDDLGARLSCYPRAGFEWKRWAWLARPYYKLRGRSIRPFHRPEACRECGRCLAVCPVGCLERRGRRILVGPTCIRCLACHEACAHGAMLLRCPWWLKPMFRGRAEGLDTSKLV